MPAVNPDGHNVVFTENSWWRKNMREDYGVDLNRNCPFDWDGCGGSSGYTWSDTYHVKADGSYHFVLQPGMYRLTFMLSETNNDGVLKKLLLVMML